MIELEHSATQGERDYMVGNGNAVNPIINLPNYGVMLWEQHTADRLVDLKNRIAQRRLIYGMRRDIKRSAVRLLQEQNDANARERLKLLLEGMCEFRKANEGIELYTVVVTSPALHELHGDVTFKPIGAVEQVTISFIATDSSVSFT